MSETPQTLHDGRYRIERVLGVGGMSVVLLAFDTRMGVHRAIKLLNRRFASSPQVRERFETEASAQASLRHPNILMVHDVVEDSAGVYLVMELAEEGSLAEKVKYNGPLSPRETARMGSNLARALGVAHEAGVVHRDIKPENILVDRHGNLKIADFGIARVVARNANLTQTGMVMGTWAYMPPEQRESARQVDGRSDIYALGACLYFLLTGRQPSALHNSESHRVAFQDVPPDLAAVLQNATRLYPEDRYQDCEELAVALDGLLDQLSTEPIVDFEPPTEPPDTIAPAVEDLSTYIHSHPDVAATLAPFLEAFGPGTAVPEVEADGSDTPPTPPRNLAAPAAAAATTPPPQDTTPPALAANPNVVTQSPVTTLPEHTIPPTGRNITGSQLLIFVLGILASVLAIVILLPRLINPPGATPAPTATAPTMPLATPPPHQAPLEQDGDGAQADADASDDDDPKADTPPATGSTKAASGGSASKSSSGSSSSGSTSSGSSSGGPRIITVDPTAGASSSGGSTSGGDTTAGSTTPVDPTGIVVVRTVPSGASVSLGGETLSRSGRGYILPVGNHVLDIRSPAGESTRRAVQIRKDQTVEICYSFDTNSACSEAETSD